MTFKTIQNSGIIENVVMKSTFKSKHVDCPGQTVSSLYAALLPPLYEDAFKGVVGREWYTIYNLEKGNNFPFFIGLLYCLTVPAAT